jgi:hypothetical protein
VHPIRLFSLFAVTCAIACTAGTSPTASGRGGSGGGNSGVGNNTGSAGTGGPAGGGSGTMGLGGFDFTGAGGSGGRTCGLQRFDVERKPAEILLLLDRSKSMVEDYLPDGVTLKWNAALPALKQVIMNTDTSVSWGLKVFPEGDGDACIATCVTNNPVVPIAPMNAAAVIAGIDATTPAGNGTPTGAAVNAAVAYLQSLTSKNPKYILLATDGQPSCAALPTSSPGSDVGGPYAETAVTAALSAGFPTFVLGVSTMSSGEVKILNALADEGGKPRPNAPLTHFYLGTSQAELTAAMAAITGQAATCTFPLNPPPPVMNDPTKLGMYFPPSGTPQSCTTDCPNGQTCVSNICMLKVPYDGSMGNGWAYTDANDTAVQAYGSWCDQIKASGANTVQVIYGCPLIDVP